jgi:LmbE family N-acetylglucosaminyl deacetylase
MHPFLKKLNPYYHRPYVREILALRAQSGPYRFLVSDWKKRSDVDLVARMLATEYFRDGHTLVELPVENLRSILVIAPHQDDEIIGAGGSLLLASRAGVRIEILYLTDGAQRKPDYSPADMAHVRDQEAQLVCSKLNATMYRLGVSNLKPNPGIEHLDLLADILHRSRPQVVMVPWLLDLPAKHRLVNHLLWLAHRRRRLPDFEVWGYQVHNPLFPNGYVDITAVADGKRDLLECFRSQNKYCRYDHQALGMAAWNTRFLENQAEPRYAELFFTLPLREQLGLIESFYFKDLQATYRGDTTVLEGAREIHRKAVPSYPIPW